MDLLGHLISHCGEQDAGPLVWPCRVFTLPSDTGSIAAQHHPVYYLISQLPGTIHTTNPLSADNDKYSNEKSSGSLPACWLTSRGVSSHQADCSQPFTHSLATNTSLWAWQSLWLHRKQALPFFGTRNQVVSLLQSSKVILPLSLWPPFCSGTQSHNLAFEMRSQPTSPCGFPTYDLRLGSSEMLF